eukprot:1383476-Pyramimonas_sp.AAC.1
MTLVSDVCMLSISLQNQSLRLDRIVPSIGAGILAAHCRMVDTDIVASTVETLFTQLFTQEFDSPVKTFYGLISIFDPPPETAITREEAARAKRLEARKRFNPFRLERSGKAYPHTSKTVDTL